MSVTIQRKAHKFAKHLAVTVQQCSRCARPEGSALGVQAGGTIVGYVSQPDRVQVSVDSGWGAAEQLPMSFRIMKATVDRYYHENYRCCITAENRQ